MQEFPHRVGRGGGHNVGVDKHHVGSGHVDCLTYDHVGLKTHVAVYTCAFPFAAVCFTGASTISA